MAVTLLALLVVAALVLAAGWRWGGLGRAGLLPLAAALMLGAAGYAWEGRPGLPGAPTATAAVDRPDMEDMMALRDRLGGGGFSSGRAWLIFADGRMRAGRPDQAAGILLSATRQYPGNRDLQTALAFALIAYADDSVTPAAELALGAGARDRPRLARARLPARRSGGARRPAGRRARALVAPARPHPGGCPLARRPAGAP